MVSVNGCMSVCQAARRLCHPLDLVLCYCRCANDVTTNQHTDDVMNVNAGYPPSSMGTGYVYTLSQRCACV